MALFPFNAETCRSDWSTIFDTAEKCAEYLWSVPSQTLAELAFDDACALAVIDPDIYDALWCWAKDNEHTEQVKVRLFDALVRDRPRAGKAKTQYRDTDLRLIAAILMRDYSLLPTRNEASAGSSASSILAQLKGAPSERTIEGIIRPQR